MLSPTLELETVTFRRTEHSDKETGVLFNNGSSLLIDMEGHAVPAPIWDWHPDFQLRAIVRNQPC